ncbi:MAG: PDZ domain-containing protein, partial [Gemmatimonadetes bacterium]
LLAGAAAAPAAAQRPEAGAGWLGVRADLHVTSHEDGRVTTRVVITEALSGGPARRAGVQPGDTVVRLDGRPLTLDGWMNAVRTLRPGERLRLTLARDGHHREVVVEAGRRPTFSPTVAQQIDSVRAVLSQRLDSLAADIEAQSLVVARVSGAADSLGVVTARLLDNVARLGYTPEVDRRLEVVLRPDSVVVGDGSVSFFTADGRRVAGGVVTGPEARWQVDVGGDGAVATRLWTGEPRLGGEDDVPFGLYVLRSPDADSLIQERARLRILATQAQEVMDRRLVELERRGITGRAALRDREVRTARAEVAAARNRLIEVERRLNELKRLELTARADSAQADQRARGTAARPEAPRRDEAERTGRTKPEARGGRAGGVSRGGRGEGARPAVPTVEPYVPRTLTAGFAGRYLLGGAELSDLNEGLAAYFGVEAGVLVTDVLAGTPAAHAGLRAGDVV